LEVGWETLEDANIAPSTLFGSQTGIFIGTFWDDYSAQRLHAVDAQAIDRYAILSNARSMVTGRLAHLLGVHGPNLQVDTTCSSSLTAIHLACQALRNGECEQALAGGAFLLVSPEITIGLCRMGALAEDGRCKAFDQGANGFGQGEGCGMVLLKTLAKAQAAGDTVLVVIRGSAINHDGQSRTITTPNGLAQQALLRQAIHQAAVAPQQIQYVEAHGTGTTLGDPVEVFALAEVLGKERTTPLAIGSVKTNIGHTNAAAGVAGLLKVVLALQHGELPPTLHVQQLNARIPWQKLGITVPTTVTPWPAPTEGQPRLAGVSAFGMNGSNAHVIVAEAPHQPADLPAAGLLPTQTLERPYQLLPLSAKSAAALRAQVESYHTYLAQTDLSQTDLSQTNLAQTEDAAFADICYTAAIGRDHFPYRMALVAATRAEAIKQLAAQQQMPATLDDPASGGRAPKLAFLFTGQGAQYLGMGRTLYATNSIFRDTLNHCDALLQEHLGESILKILYPDEETGQPGDKALVADEPAFPSDPGQPLKSKLDETVYTQPALFALEYALATLWQAWGIQPDVLIGHSVGEVVAACVAGVFTLADGLKLIAARGRLMHALPQDGAMISLLAPDSLAATFETRVAEAIAAYYAGAEPVEVSIAAVNGPTSVVIAGRSEAVSAIAEQLAAEGVKPRKLTVSHAFHSPLMAPMLDEFGQVAASITYHKPKRSLISNVTGKLAGAEVTTPAYWVRHVREAVRFADGVATLQAQKVGLLLEIGPQPVLVGMAKMIYALQAGHGHSPLSGAQAASSNAKAKSPNSVLLPSLRQGSHDWQQMLESLGALYTHGVAIDWARFYGRNAYRKVRLPTYPFQRQRYWVEQHRAQPPDQVSASPTTLTNLLTQEGDLFQRLHMITAGQHFTTAEMALLPKLLQALAQQQSVQPASPAGTNAVKEWLYEITWRLQVLPDQPEANQASGDWLILADQGGWGYALAQQIADQGGRPLLVYARRAATSGQIPTVVVDPIDSAAFQRLFDQQSQPFMLRAVIHLWGLDAPASAHLTAATLAETQRLACGSLLQLTQWLAELGRGAPQRSGKLWVVTQNAQAVVAADQALAVAQAPLWGLGRTIVREYAELWGGLVDLAADTAANPVGVQRLLTEMLAETPEAQLAFRGSARYVARLGRTQPKGQTMTLDPQATYLITGGVGALGLQVAHWLAEQGARHLLLMSRRGVTTLAQQQAVAALVERGVTVQVAQVDVADETALGALFTELKAKQVSLRGIVHTAGVLDDGVLRNQEWSRFQMVMQPKVQGSWYLHQWSQSMPLDFFILFSSVAAAFGAMGQSNYAAANSFLDGLAHYRRQQGLPGLSINWGGWAGAGMAAQVENSLWPGLSPMQPVDACRALQTLWGAAGDYIVTPIDWSKFQQVTVGDQAFLADWLTQTPVAAERGTFAAELRATAAGERPLRLMHYLQQELRQILRLEVLPARSKGFMELGLDSLLALELKQRLERGLAIGLPATIALEYPTIERLAEHLLDEVLAWADPLSSSVRPSTATQTASDHLDELSQEELAQLLMQKLRLLS